MNDINRLETTLQDSQNGTEMGQKVQPRIASTRLPRTHQDYWLVRLRKRTYTHQNATVEIPTWQVRIAYLNRREWFNLETNNRTVAAIKARDIYLSLVSKGWTDTLDKFKPAPLIAVPKLTLNEFAASYRKILETLEYL